MYHHPDDRDDHSQTCSGTHCESSMVSWRSFAIGGAAALGGVLLGGGQGAVAAVPNGAGQGTVAAVPHRIDVHHHIIPPQFLKEAPPSADFQRNWAWWTPQKSLEEMDQNGIAVSMLSFATPYEWFSGIEPGRRLARMCNDYCAEQMRDNVGRFGLFAGVPPLEDTEGCLREIAYAFDTLQADGVTVMTSYGDKYLGDAAYAPVWEELNRRRAVVFVHPSEPTCCNPDLGLHSAYAEWPFDTARTVMSLWASNALLRWPHIRFIFSHGGGGLPMVADRIDKFGRPDLQAGPDAPMLHDALSQIRTLYFDTANAANPPALAATRAMVDPGHILFGSDYPFVPASRAVDGLAHAQLNPQELRGIERDNAIALMPQLGRPL